MALANRSSPPSANEIAEPSDSLESMIGRSHAMSDQTAMDPLRWQRVGIHALQAPNVHRPAIERLNPLLELTWRGIAGTPKRENAADWTEVVLRSHRAPLIKRHGFPRR